MPLRAQPAILPLRVVGTKTDASPEATVVYQVEIPPTDARTLLSIECNGPPELLAALSFRLNRLPTT